MKNRLLYILAGSLLGTAALSLTALADNPINFFWKNLLKDYDTNGDEKITGREWTNLWNDVTQQNPGGDGYLSVTRDELVDWLREHGYSVNDANDLADEILNEYDTDGDGELSPAEFYKFVREHTPGAEPVNTPVLPIPVPS